MSRQAAIGRQDQFCHRPPSDPLVPVLGSVACRDPVEFAGQGYCLARLPSAPGAELLEPGCWPVAARSLSIAFTTGRDSLGLFALVRGSAFDSSRPYRTYRTYMACRKSEVRVPLAPLELFSQVRGLERHLIPHRGMGVGLSPCLSADAFLQVRAVLRALR